MTGALVFDLDGTLIDSAPDIHAACVRMLADYGHAPLAPERIQSFVGNGAPRLVERVMGAVGETTGHADWLARFLAHYAADPATLTRPYPGVPEVLEHLAEAGHALGICTNKPETPAREILRRLGLDRHFAVVIGGDSTAATKPDPLPLARAYEALPGGPRLFVGDSEVDAATARALPVTFALFTEGYRKSPLADLPHDFAFSRFDDLPALVNRALAR
ncbi:phosphoglycolate phosphatase [Neotabrizicola shimadae]|uniref:Phosphoglycolate phosphatase n=1 Tax=Neotabrizicola shimadae TaxID=2807096 RepID=A0A8G1EDJ8_9RHOB|nr:phosphoglycolate phosphatase [Neotabrizicola shimadae]QYZ70243.1 phosphoglycolate phosphatase [Neotabrizicola shimadae]